MGLAADNAARKVTIAASEPGLDWTYFKAIVTCSAGTAELFRNEPATGTDLLTGATASETKDPIAATNTPLKVGDYLVVGCSTTTAGTTVELVIVFKPANTVVGTMYKFSY